ncbi:hypothetical protein BW730_00860 [Tessaracoccus aquimaris]|uniref:HNH nuclease domain-containing protein n=1 Tax=Tessaracoccus aquimaris TaxID=1332264 RepID=A0A1Q2CJS1_9ACTN|nr:HNH endonuclease signature motif containing protein [Tessaracoccus aquimaris]AQP46333.1 hypothetical protein BW730_00860 [Tessaracoccus aquimaris]
MFDSLQRGSQELMAALWHAATTLSEHDERAARLASVMETLEQIQAQAEGLKLHLLHEANLDGLASVIDQHRSTPRHDSARTSADLRLADDLSERFTMIKAALVEGTVSAAQASAMVFGLKKLPTIITGRVLEVCQAELIELAGSFSPHELRHAALEVWALLDPEAAEHEEGARLDRERRRAEAIRSVRLTDSCHGYMTLTGRLPLADGALLQAQLDALTPPLSSYASEAMPPTRDARRADALMSLAHHSAAAGSLPRLGLDRPTVSITVSLESLRDGIGSADLIGIDAASLTAGEARRLACDANLIPVVLGGRSEPLDVGRRRRLVTSGIRAALTRRDAGCAFPHCTMPPAVCEAHHIQPWHDGGATSLDNLVLLCPRHHRLVEPDPLQSEVSQWQVWIDADSGEPWFRPPGHIDFNRAPRQHRRHRLRRLESDLANEFEIRDAPADGEDSAHTPAIRFPEPHEDPWHPDYRAGRSVPS